MKKRRQVVAVLKDELGRILLQLRDENPERYPNHWAFFGGGIEEKETPEEALKREIEEELGIDVKNYNFKPLKKYELKDGQVPVEENVFISPVKNPVSELGLTLGEGRGLAFFSCEEMKNIKFPEYEKPILKDLCNLTRS